MNKIKLITNGGVSKAKQIWKHFDINNMGGYRDLYVKTDVSLLTDVFEKNRMGPCVLFYISKFCV